MEREQNLSTASTKNNPEICFPERDIIEDIPEEPEASDFEDYREMAYEVTR